MINHRIAKEKLRIDLKFKIFARLVKQRKHIEFKNYIYFASKSYKRHALRYISIRSVSVVASDLILYEF